MSTARAQLPAVVEHGAGLVVMLDAAGRTIAELEAQVDRLTAAVAAEREDRIRLTELLHACQQAAATEDVPQDSPTDDENGAHARQDSPPPAT